MIYMHTYPCNHIGCMYNNLCLVVMPKEDEHL